MAGRLAPGEVLSDEELTLYTGLADEDDDSPEDGSASSLSRDGG